MKLFAERKEPCNLAVSLHAPDDEIRNRLMPVNRRYSISQVIESAKYYVERTNRKVLLEYILLDGINIKEYDYAEYMSLFSPVFQDFKLFSFSVKENIVLNESCSDDELNKLIVQVGLSEKIASMENGTATNLFKAFDENGIEPSGGEQQKIAIARALYKKAPVVILDEPTAALDPVAEYDIYRQFDTLVGEKTAIYISHRLSSCKFCDRIAVFSEGRIKEYGTHDELSVQNGGIYAEMFAAQAQYYRD